MTRIAIVTSTVRPGRQSLAVAQWIQSIAEQREDATFEIVDIADHPLHAWAEGTPPSAAPGGESANSRKWASTMAEFDGYVFVVAEYNRSVPGALKNALDYLYTELNDKVAAFVSYGSVGGARAVEHLRTILSEMHVAHVRNVVALPRATEFQDGAIFAPTSGATASVTPMLDQLLRWSQAMSSLRVDVPYVR